MDLQSLRETIQRFGGPVQRLEDYAVVVKRHVGFRMLSQRQPEIGFGFAKPAELRQHDAEEIEAADMFRLGAQDFFERMLGVLEFSRLERRQTALQRRIFGNTYCQRCPHRFAAAARDSIPARSASIAGRPAAASHLATNAAMRSRISSPASRGTWPWSGTSIRSMLGCRACMAVTVAAARMSELAPRMTRSGTRDSASNSFHIAGSGRSMSTSASVRANCTS